MAKTSIAKVRQRPNVTSLSLAAFFNDTGSDMLFAFYPLFVALILKANMTALGLIESIALLMGLLLRPIVGKLSDVRGRTKLIWGGYLCLGLSRLTQSLAQVWYHLVPPKMLYEVGRGIRNPPREALLAESVPQDERGLAFGILQSMDTLGAILGPILGLGIFMGLIGAGFSDETTYRVIFLVASLPTLASIWLTSTQLKEVRTPAEIRREEAPATGTSAGDSYSFGQERTLLLFTAVSCLFSLWAVSENFMLLSGAKILGISREEVWPIVILYWFINLTFAPTALLAGRLSDRYGRKPFLGLSLTILGALTVLFAFVTRFWQVGLLFALHGVYQGFLKPSQTALVADLAPAEHRAEVLGRYSMWIGLFAIPAPSIFGLLWDSFTWKVPFIVSGICVGLSAALLMLLVKPRREATWPSG